MPISIIQKERVFELDLIFHVGEDHIRDLTLAVDLANSIGTDRYSAEDMVKEAYKSGLQIRAFSQSDKVIFRVAGMQEHMEKGVRLLNHFLEKATIDNKAFKKYIDAYIKKRNDKKRSSWEIKRGLVNYALYGENSRFRNKLSEKQLLKLTANSILSLIHDLKTYDHHVFYFWERFNGS